MKSYFLISVVYTINFILVSELIDSDDEVLIVMADQLSSC